MWRAICLYWRLRLESNYKPFLKTTVNGKKTRGQRTWRIRQQDLQKRKRRAARATTTRTHCSQSPITSDSPQRRLVLARTARKTRTAMPSGNRRTEEPVHKILLERHRVRHSLSRDESTRRRRARLCQARIDYCSVSQTKTSRPTFVK